jgi:hypothetical protein
MKDWRYHLAILFRGEGWRHLIGGNRNIGFAEIIALEQQRCRFILRQRVGATVAEIEPRIVSSTAVASKGRL